MAIAIPASDYEVYRAWFAVVCEFAFPLADTPNEFRPLNVLDDLFAKSPANARKGLAMAIGDLLEDASDWNRDRLDALEIALNESKLPSFAKARFHFDKSIRRIINRKVIRNEVEYYAVRNVVEAIGDSKDREFVWDMLSDFESKLPK